MKYVPDYSCRFRILKGGKVALVVSALLTSSTTIAATTINISTATTVPFIFAANDDVLNILSPDGSIDNTNTDVDPNQPIAVKNAYTGVTLHNTGAISATSTENESVFGVKSSLTGSFLSLNTSGTITTLSNDLATGISIESGASNYITNDTGGVISATSTGALSEAVGIKIAGFSTFVNSLMNKGRIETDAYVARGIWQAGGDFQDITNDGVIEATGVDGAYGIWTWWMDAGSENVTNTTNGVINVSAKGSGNYELAAGIYLDNEMYESAQIKNDGTINVTYETGGTTGTAYGIRVGNIYNTSIIQNNGDINVTSDAVGTSVYGINILSINDTPTISNSGTITVNSAGGGETVGFYVRSAGHSMENSGEIYAKINGEYDNDAYSIKNHLFSAPIIVNNTSTGKLYGNISIRGTVNNDGLISLPHNAEATITDFNQGATGVLEIGLLTDGTLGNTTYSKLATDNAVFADGSTIRINVLDASTSVGLLSGTKLLNVIATDQSGLTIAGTLNIEDNSALLDFTYETELGMSYDYLHLNVVGVTSGSSGGSTILNSTIAGNGDDNAIGGARALQTIVDAGTYSAMTSYTNALTGLATDSEVAKAVASTTPAATNASSTATTQIMNGLQGIVEMRQNNFMGGGMNSGDESLAEKNLWVKLYGSRGTQDNKDGINGFDVNAYGLGIGADAEISPSQRIGAALFYTDANVDVNDMAQTSDMKVYTALVYGNVPMNSNTDFLYQAGYSWQKTQSYRTVLPTYDHATADYTSKTASLDLKVMQTHKLDDTLTVKPLVEGTYRYYTNPSYSENGAGAMNLQVEKFTSTQLITSAGAIIDYRLNKDSKLVTDLRLGYDWHHDNQSVTAAYQGASAVTFNTKGIDNGGWQYNVGLGYDTTNVLGGELDFMYNYQGQGNSFENHVLSAKYIYKF